MTHPASKGLRVAIVGASTLKGREVKSLLSERGVPVSKLALMDSDEDLGRISEFDGEPVVTLAVTKDSFDFVDVVFFAGNTSITRQYAPLAASNRFLAIDLTNAFGPGRFAHNYLWSTADEDVPQWPADGLLACPHPAALVVATILRRLVLSYSLKHCVVNIFEPASERGSGGVEELERQTLNIFSFQPSPHQVFDRQLAFNLLSRLGEAAKDRLIDSEEAIAGQLQVCLKGVCPMPSLTLIQAPVFHSHSFSFFVEIPGERDIAGLEAALNCESLEVVPSPEEPPSPVQVAGTDRIQVGGMKRDFFNPEGVWFWAAADNLRLAAINAVSAMEHFLLRKPA